MQSTQRQKLPALLSTCFCVNRLEFFSNNAKIVNVTNKFMHREIAKGKSLSAEEENLYACCVLCCLHSKTTGADLLKSHLFHPIAVQKVGLTLCTVQYWCEGYIGMAHLIGINR